MDTRQNSGWLDRFRIIAALLVVAIHTSPLAGLSEGADFFLTRILARIAVPFFLMVTGQFVASGFLDPSPRTAARLHKFLQKTAFLYVFCILLYLPVGLYAGHYKEMTVLSAVRMVVFDGTFYHLWYFPACILGILLVRLMSRFLNLRWMTVVSVFLYIIGLFGDSYYGLARQVPAIETMYDALFRLFSYTRNGLFLAPVFLVLGMWMAVRQERGRADSASPLLCAGGLAASFAAMTAEAFTLRHFELQRHDSMYFCLLPVMFFLYQCLLYAQAGPQKGLRTAAAWIYVLHPGFIVVVRGIAKPLHLTELLVDNALIHYIAVALLSVAAGFFMSYIQGRRRRFPDRKSRFLRRTDDGLPCESGGQDQEDQEVSDMQETEQYSEYDNWDMPDAADEDLDNEPSLLPESETDASMTQEFVLPRSRAAADVTDEDKEANADDYILKIMSGRPPRRQQTAAENKAAPLMPDGMETDDPNEQYEPDFGGTRPECEYTDRVPVNETEPEPPTENPRSRAWIELDAKALEQNVELFRSRIPEHCRLMPAVKADAYGHGLVPVSQLLSRMGVDAFCVACISEGIALRKAGISGKILILGYTSPEDFPLLYHYRLLQTVVDFPYAQELNRFDRKLHVHIGIDTGMHRLGIRCENMEEITAVYQMENLAVDGLFTHLCVSDSPHPEHRAFTSGQLRAFYQVIRILREEGYPCPGLHILASYGILNLLQDRTADRQTRFPSAGRAGLDADQLAADYVRPGIALYGVLSTQTDQNVWKDSLKPVLSLKARVTSVRPLHAGESVSYGITFTADREMQIAAVAIGYADGLPRELSGGKGSVLINGRRAAILGRICMDQCIVDVSRIPDVKRGDTAVIIGCSGREEITAAQIAETCGTISHEILTGLAARLGRIVIES